MKQKGWTARQQFDELVCQMFFASLFIFLGYLAFDFVSKLIVTTHVKQEALK